MKHSIGSKSLNQNSQHPESQYVGDWERLMLCSAAEGLHLVHMNNNDLRQATWVESLRVRELRPPSMRSPALSRSHKRPRPSPWKAAVPRWLGASTLYSESSRPRTCDRCPNSVSPFSVEQL